MDPMGHESPAGAFAVAEGNSICFQVVQLIEHFVQSSLTSNYERLGWYPGDTPKMAIYSGFSHQQLWFSIAMLVYQRVVR